MAFFLEAVYNKAIFFKGSGIVIRKASKMKVFKNCFAEYKRRHDEIWPEMKEELKRHGATNYSIYLDETTGDLFAYVEVEDEALYAGIADTAVCKKWWAYMRDVMETNPDNSPVSVDLKPVFYLA